MAFDAERVTVDQKGTTPNVIVPYEELRSIRKQPLGAGAKIGLAVGALTAASVVGADLRATQAVMAQLAVETEFW